MPTVLAGFLGYCVQEYDHDQGCKCWLSAEGLQSLEQPWLSSQQGLKEEHTLDLSQIDWCLGKGNVWPNATSASAVIRKRHFRATVMYLQLPWLNSAEGCWGHRRVAVSPSILCLHLDQSLLWKGLRVLTAHERLILWLPGCGGMEGGQPAKLLVAKPSLGIPTFLEEIFSETYPDPYSNTHWH